MRQRLKSVALAGLAMAIGLGVAGIEPAHARCEAGETVINFAHSTNTDRDSKGIAATLLAERVNAQMDGQLCMLVFPRGSLVEDDGVLQALQNNEAQMAALSTAQLAAIDSAFNVLQLPFLFPNAIAFDRFAASPAVDRLKSRLHDQSLQALTFWRRNTRQLAAVRPLLAPTDVARLKYLATDEMSRRMFVALGAYTAPVLNDTVDEALRSNRIDGHDSGWVTMASQDLLPLQEGVTVTNHRIDADLVVASGTWWRSASPEVQQKFWSILWQLTSERNQAVDEAEQRARNWLEQSGASVHELDAGQRGAWVAAVQPVWEESNQDIDGDLLNAALQSGRAPN